MDQLAELFADIFNLSLLQSEVPTYFKKTTIILVPKKNHAACLNDYHLVDPTSVIMKYFERLLNSSYTHGCVANFQPNSIYKFADGATIVGQIANNDETKYRKEIVLSGM
eukprot:g37966.t1